MSYKFKCNQIEYADFGLPVLQMNEDEISELLKGQLEIFCLKEERQFIVNTELIDYVFRLARVFPYLDSGATETFIVSGDYYSHHVDFYYDLTNKTLTLTDRDTGNSAIVDYVSFKDEFNKFFSSFVLMLEAKYQHLIDNVFWISMLKECTARQTNND